MNFNLVTVESNYMNTMKTTFDVNFDLNQAVNLMDKLKHKSLKNLSIKKLLFDYLLPWKS